MNIIILFNYINVKYKCYKMNEKLINFFLFYKKKLFGCNSIFVEKLYFKIEISEDV